MRIQERLRAMTFTASDDAALQDHNTAREAAALLDEAERVVEGLANDLEAEVKQRWGDDERLASRLARDLSPVVEARAFLAKLKEQPNEND